MSKATAVLDVGTTSVRCYVYDEKFSVIATASREIEILIPHHGHNEIEPIKLYEDSVTVISEAISESNLKFDDVVLGITTQRSSFTTWSKTSGKTFHNFVTWKDIRADAIVEEWNNSMTLGGINVGAGLLHFFTRSQKFLAGSVLKLTNHQVTPRLLWVLKHNKQLQDALRINDAMFGTIESYLLYKFRQGKSNDQIEHIMDITNAIATGFYDPFTMSWAGWAMNIFKLEKKLLPKVVDNSYNYGNIHPSIFGTSVKISAVIADQAASIFGQCCFDKGDAKITLGTGTFYNINTASKCHASILGLYPQIAYSIRDTGVAFDVEGYSSDTANVVLWGMSIGLYENPSESSGMAEVVSDSDGVYFIPGFNGLSAPINDFNATAGFIGIKLSTTKSHLVRALLESIVFRVAQLLNAAIKETNFVVKKLRADGGVSKNDFVLQTLADLCQIVVDRSDPESTALGAAYLSAFNMKFKTLEDLKREYKPLKVFNARKEKHEAILKSFREWERAVERFKGWYTKK